jgi:hypothetical protein
VATELVPALDPAPIPGPPGLLVFLWVVTFFLHLLCVNAALGGALFSALLPAALRPEARRPVSLFFADVGSWAISLAVTFAVAPLLFLQTLYGRFFYSASILIAPVWLGLLALLMVAYYLNWIAKFRLRAGRDAALSITLSALLLVTIAAIQVAVYLIQVQPSLWTVYAARPAAVLADPTFVPRLLHFLLAALSMAAILPAAWPRAAGADPAGVARFGLLTALVATAAQFVVGLWLLGVLPKGVLMKVMTGGAATLGPLAAGILVGVALVGLLVRALAAPGNVRLARVALGHLVAAAAFMVVTRHQLRDLYLAAARANERLEVVTQWNVLVLFLGVFVLCASLTVWAVVRAVKDRPGPGEAAA